MPAKLNFASMNVPATRKKLVPGRLAAAPQPVYLRDKVLELKREEILRVAGEMFFTKGYTQTSLDDIASALAIGKPQIYACFENKTALLAQVCTRTSALAAELAAETLKTRGTPTARLTHIVRGLCLGVIEGRMSMAVLFREVKHLPPEAVDELAANFHSFNRCLGDLLKEGAAAGDFSVSEPSVVTLAISGMTTWIYSWYRPDGSLGAEQIADEMVTLALRMVGARR